ncbi:hypothetical protein Gasu2_17310 [Galdieria sulphuraria]|nr:hypothetical protein Gasu2_17310 [Galdieria sulphuraria]
MTCIVCLERSVNVLLLPCRHEETCSYCTILLDDRLCPLCRSPVNKVEILKPSDVKMNMNSEKTNFRKDVLWKTWCLSCIIESRKEQEEELWASSKQVLLTGSFGLPLLEIQRFFLEKFRPGSTTEEFHSIRNSNDIAKNHPIYLRKRKKFKIWNSLHSLCILKHSVTSSKEQNNIGQESFCECKEYVQQFSSFWGLQQRFEMFKPNMEMEGKRIRLFTKYYWEWLRLLQGNDRLLPEIVFLVFSEEKSNSFLSEALDMFDLMAKRYRSRFQRFPKIFFLYLKNIHHPSHDKYDSLIEIHKRIYQRSNSHRLLISMTIQPISGKCHILDGSNFENALRSF